MNISASRRGFLRGLAGATAFGIAGCKCPFGCQKIKLAAVGINGKGFTDWLPMVKSGLAELVAWCDADANQLKSVLNDKRVKEIPGLAEKLSKIPFYTDYRRLMDNAGALGIDAMTVSTPDHMHAAIAVNAMKQGIHVYVQKPLVRTLWELDYFKRTAKDNGVITQMGNQGSGTSGLRRGTEILRSGILGDVREVHVWTNRPVWPQGFAMKKASEGAADAIPAGLDWEAWIGIAKMRNYKGKLADDVPTFNPWNPKQRFSANVYHSFNWRGFIDFGCGAFGDMACHTMNLPFRGLELGICTKAECTMIEEKNDVAFPTKSIVRLTFAARESAARPGVKLPEVQLYWYDGNHKPPASLMPDGKVPNTGCIVIGSKGTLCSTNDYGGSSTIAMKGETVMQDMLKHPACVGIPTSIPRCGEGVSKVEAMGGAGVAAADNDGHYTEFLNAIRGEGPEYDETNSRCYSDVDFSVPIMEGILCGCVAQQVAGPLNWDSKAQKFDVKAANELYKPFIREGYAF